MDAYRRLLSSARRFSRDRAEAEDLLHDALLIALKAGRSPLTDPADAPWFAGVLRNMGAMRARTAARRRARERACATPADDDLLQDDLHKAFDTVLAPMTPATRAVAILIMYGLNAREICWIHRLSPTAFRQRLTAVRKALKTLPVELRGAALATALARPGIPGLEVGLIRRALRAALERLPGVGSHDLDGHLIVLTTGAHKVRPGGN